MGRGMGNSHRWAVNPPLRIPRGSCMGSDNNSGIGVDADLGMVIDLGSGLDMRRGMGTGISMASETSL